MCGITAVSRPEKSSIPDARTFMRLAALAIEERGPDATGFAWIDAKYNGWYWKTPKTARTAIREAPLVHGMQTIIGHTRWATQGKKSDNFNNHPVVDDGIMLVHNGIIDNEDYIYSFLNKDYVNKAEVDTACIAAMLANPQHYDGRTVGQMLELLNGDASLAWLDSNDHSILHLARVQGRPMAIGYTRRGDLVMSSTRETLADTALWSGVNIDKVEDVPEGTYMQVRNGQIIHQEVFVPNEMRSWKKYTPTVRTAASTVAKSPLKLEVATPFDEPRDDWGHTEWWDWIDSARDEDERTDREDTYWDWAEDTSEPTIQEEPNGQWTEADWDEYLDSAIDRFEFSARYHEWERYQLARTETFDEIEVI